MGLWLSRNAPHQPPYKPLRLSRLGGLFIRRRYPKIKGVCKNSYHDFNHPYLFYIAKSVKFDMNLHWELISRSQYNRVTI